MSRASATNDIGPHFTEADSKAFLSVELNVDPSALTSDQRKLLHEHLLSCQPCRAQVAVSNVPFARNLGIDH